MKPKADKHFFGIRHLSPASSYYLLKFINKISPDIILLEGPSDANYLIKDIAKSSVIPPLAILAYTTILPVKTLLYPFAVYSPEYQAIKWGDLNKIKVEFIDLPSYVFLSKEINNNDENLLKNKFRGKFYDSITTLSEEDSFETFWERNFEQAKTLEVFTNLIIEFSKNLRGYEDHLLDKENLLRESFMRSKILKIEEEGYKNILVVSGAYHSTELDRVNNEYETALVSDVKISDSKVTLMPYSYLRLSSQSGYGAGNDAPQYFEDFWNFLNDNKLHDLATYYLGSLSKLLREEKYYSSTADIIEAVQLSKALTSLHHSYIPTLSDITYSAVTTIGKGEISKLAKNIARLDVGTKIGFLPLGISSTLIQEDFNKQLVELKLEKFKSNVAQTLELDLRENISVKSKELAYMDLKRSYFLYKLVHLNISFAKKNPNKQQKSTWSESWTLRWTPEVEIELIETILKGESIDLALGLKCKEILTESNEISAIIEVLKISSETGNANIMETTTIRLQEISKTNDDFHVLTNLANDLAHTVSYGSIRKYPVENLQKLLAEIFFRCNQLLLTSSFCNDEESQNMIKSIIILQNIIEDHFEILNIESWYESLKKLSDEDNVNYKLSGLACSILIEKVKVDETYFQQQLKFRFSNGVKIENGAAWFEGFSSRNKYSLLSREIIWKYLNEYLSNLDELNFPIVLIYLRRTFALFNSSEKFRISEILGNLWQIDSIKVGKIITSELTNEENAKLNTLNNIDLDDL